MLSVLGVHLRAEFFGVFANFAIGFGLCRSLPRGVLGVYARGILKRRPRRQVLARFVASHRANPDKKANE